MIEENELPKIHYYPEVTSCFDVAFSLAEVGRLAVWDSVQANSQSDGRGQMRRKWLSPAGNLYAAIRLPQLPPFNSTASAVVVGALCTNALRSFGLDAWLKWPNDVVVLKNGKPEKLGGILLEEKNNVLIAGIGINVFVAPEITDREMALPAAAMSDVENSANLPTTDDLWRALVKHIYTVYKNEPVFAEIWQHLAAHLLLWHGEQVVITDDEETCSGNFLGVAENGAARIDASAGIVEKLSGVMKSQK